MLDISTAINPPTLNLVIKYWNRTSWTVLTLTSDPNPFYSTGVNSFSFSAPADWATKTVNGVSGYWIATGDPDNFGGDHSGEGSSGGCVSQISVLLAAAEGGGAPVPEFTDMVYFTTLLAGGAYFYKRNSEHKKQQYNFQKSLSGLFLVAFFGFLGYHL